MVSSTPFAHNVTQKKAAPEMSANAQQTRQLSIKTGVVRRLFKEESIYKTEVVDAQARVEKLKADGADDADVRNAERVVKDAEQMIPRTRQALDEAVVALEDLVSALASESEIAGSDEYKAASTQLETVKSSQQSA